MISPLPHQIEAIQRTVAMDGLQFLKHKTGTGKTFTTIATYKYWRDTTYPNLRMVVVCPINLIEGAWMKELSKLRSENGWELTWRNLNNGMQSHQYFKDNKPDILLVNYEYLIGDKKFNELSKLMSDGDWFGVVDESSEFKNHLSKRAERLLGWWDLDSQSDPHLKRPKKKYFEGLRSRCRFRTALSATPDPNNRWEWWSQMYWLDPQILGDNFFAFRNRCFELRRGKQIAPGAFMNKAQLRELQRTGFKYEIVDTEWQKCMDRMKPYVHVVESLEGMPEEVDEFTIIEMSPEHRKLYNQMKNDYVAEIKREIDGKELSQYAIANVALTKLMRLRQITSGFVRVDDGTLEGKEVSVIKTNPKIEALLARIEQYGRDQTIIWCQFKWEMNEIKRILEEEVGGGVSIMNGDVAQKDRQGQCDDFIEGKNRFMIAHPLSMKFGFTFINSHYQDFFSMDSSSLNYEQCRGRIARHGQKQTCVYNHIMMKGTIDEDCYNLITGKITAAEISEAYLKGA